MQYLPLRYFVKPLLLSLYAVSVKLNMVFWNSIGAGRVFKIRGLGGDGALHRGVDKFVFLGGWVGPWATSLCKDGEPGSVGRVGMGRSVNGML